MGKAVRNDAALALLLQVIVTNLARCIQSLFNVATFEDVFLRVRSGRPNAGKTISLEFKLHGKFVRFNFSGLLALLVNLCGNAEQVLHMMAHFMGHNISLGKVTWSARAERRQASEPALAVRLKHPAE